MFSASVLHILNRSFRSVCIIKPFSSCVCSPERFIVCLDRHADGDVSLPHLFNVLDTLQRLASHQPDTTLAGLVPTHEITAPQFMKYLGERNVAFAEMEAAHLDEVIARPASHGIRHAASH
jgi:hypothetical protein